MATIGVVILATMMVAAVPAATQRTPEERSLVRWITVTGMATGLALDTFYLFTLHTGYQPDTTPLVRALIIGTTSLIQLGTVTAAFWGMGELIVRLKPRWWQAGLVGPFYGAIAGGISFGLFMGTAFGIGVPTGAITLNPDADFWPSTVSTFWEAFPRAFAGGATHGAVFGAMGGLVAAPLAALRAARTERK